MQNAVYAVNRQEWRTWLETNHNTQAGVWLAFYKKGTGKESVSKRSVSKRSVSYEEAVEEALCFGWIDGIRKGGDEERYYQRFTPRTSRSQWSEVNKRRAAKLYRQGLMTPAGLAKVDFPIEQVDPDSPIPPPSELPEPIARVLRENPPAWENLQGMSASNRQAYYNFLTRAKKPETRAKRLEQAVARLKEKKRLQDG
jgi:uncharacterized protein YdeI (YjbR/CyaY-like superfamily)